MVRGGRGYPSRSSYRGSSSRGGYGSYGDSRGKYDRFQSSRDDYHKSYKSDYMGRESRRSPDRKRLRAEAPSSRHDYYGSYGSSRHEPPSSSYSERRGYSGERHASTPYSRKEDYRRSSGPPSRGSYRGRISSRGSRGLRERAPRRRVLDTSSYTIRRRIIPRSSATWKAKVSRMRSAIVRKYAAKRRADDKDESREEKTKKEPEDETNENGDENKDETKEDSKMDTSETPEERAQKKKTFIKLECPHCGIKVITFRKYELHLISRSHLMTMRKIATKQKSILAQMRQAQRNTQNELEKNSEELTDRTNYCPLCKLNYKQKKAVHQLSESHNNMKKFLMPNCKICNITFKSPMSYESHCCSIKHIKRQQRVDTADDASGEDELENFTTIDSVGDGDGTAEDGEPKEVVNVGVEQVRKIEAYYCDLCKMYLPRGEESEMSGILSRHCSQKVHRKRYMRLKEKEKESEKEVKKEETETKKPEQEGGGEVPDSEVKIDDTLDKDDKLWADVDKDIGDILAEAQSGNKSSDEDEEDSHVNGERYDRFKLSILNEGEGAEKAEN